MNRILYSTSILLSLVLFSACEDKEITPPNEEELITTLEVRLIPPGGSSVTLSFRDLDGDGGAPPVIVADTLAAGVVYAGSVTLSNESVTPQVDITQEVADEGEEHQLFYRLDGIDAGLSYTDQDADGNPVGITFSLVTGAPGAGTMTVILRHLPDKFATGVSQGDIANAGGETDIEVTFPVIVR
jgi:hypothetical protein